ncbi:MAG TPA: ribonucleoside triphosphate reductase [Pseudothermotoga sp.]|nr:ribonucleoside triphosphate reductase [Pseudothermotoga sp.]HPP69687.1 ribonucleoside triphosphate reductase [Pseudothermotoga sp.]
MPFDVIGLIDEYLSVQDWQVKENSNMNYSLQGLNNYMVSASTAKYWLEKIYPQRIRQAHLQGDFHVHDLNLLAPYCCGWDLRDLLLRGFGGVEQKVESKPAKHFRVALMQVVNFFYTLQGEAAGAQAFSNFDTFLAPFIAYDGLSYSDVVQCMQEFVFNLNVPTRVGFQTPFVNITMDVTVPNYLANEPVIIGGEFQDRCYGEFQMQMDMLNKAFCEVMIQGDAKERIFSFPIPTYNVVRDFPWDSEVAQMILKMTAKYGVPYFANFVSSGLSPEDVRSMCCRLRLDNRELRKRGGGLFGANPMTGSIGVVTINMPRLGYLSRSVDEFFERLSDIMDLARESLVIKRKVIEYFTEAGLYPYSRVCLRTIKESFGQYWHNHFSTIGLIGMHEALVNLFGKGIDTEEGKDFAMKVLDFMRTRLVDYQQKTNSLFNLEATPAEGTSYRLARIDKERFADIFTSGETEPFYTNSTQLPVGEVKDLFKALEMQEELQTKYTGGTVFHVYLGEQVEDEKVIGLLIKKIFDNYRLPYITITPVFSICQEHGYISGEHYSCPTCGRATEVWSRVVGFYRPVQNWNPGKQEEFRSRNTYEIPCE